MFYQVIHRRVSKQIRVGYKLFPDEWENLFSNHPVYKNEKRKNDYPHVVRLYVLDLKSVL